MLYLLSPAKSLDYETPVAPELDAAATLPPFIERSNELIGVLRRQSARRIGALMDISADLANLNVARYAQWSPEFTEQNSKPAALAFDGLRDREGAGAWSSARRRSATSRTSRCACSPRCARPTWWRARTRGARACCWSATASRRSSSATTSTTRRSGRPSWWSGCGRGRRLRWYPTRGRRESPTRAQCSCEPPCRRASV